MVIALSVGLAVIVRLLEITNGPLRGRERERAIEA